MSDNIKVVVKVRPLISREIKDGLQNQWQVRNNTIYQVDSNGRESRQAFAFDKIYDVDTKTVDVYNDVAKPIVEAATAGFNGSIFAYGQTSSGKTYTMRGTEDSPGIIQLAVFNLFENIKNVPDREFLVRVSFFEIYNEQIKDLLDPKKINIKIHETTESGIKVDVTERVISSPEEVLNYIKMGEVNIQTGATNMNEKSSRSHTILQITIESREHGEGEKTSGIVNVSQLNLLDLAGSERQRQRQPGATGKTFIEGIHINRSLSALTLVIKQRSEDPHRFINYRGSKLTRILQNSLGGNAKTCIICAITPAALEETISTFQFATRAKTVKNKPTVVTMTNNATVIQNLTKKLYKLQSQLASKKNLEDKLEEKINAERELQKQIAGLQKYVLNGPGGGRRAAAVGGGARRRATIAASRPPDDLLAGHNPMQMPESSKYVASQNARKLPTVAEEPRGVRVIDIDSDDDYPSCSPTHQCYGSCNTPPCILRKTAKLAEKKYEDIIEFTKREKIFEPSLLEVMEKFEESTHRIWKLQEEIKAMEKSSNIKDLEIDHLKIKIKKIHEEIDNAKMQLIKEKNSYEMKLNDLEVSYDTLKKKFELQVEELLPLLEEQKLKKCEVIGTLSSCQIESVVEASKDLSLVSSNNENSFTQLNYVENSVPKTKTNDIVLKSIFNKICDITKYFDMETPVTVNKINYELEVVKILDDLIIHIAQNQARKLENKTSSISVCANKDDRLSLEFRNSIQENCELMELLEQIEFLNKKSKQNEYELTAVLDTKNDELKKLQQENDALSGQLMDKMSESEDLTKELNKLKQDKLDLHEKYLLLEADVKNPVKCLKCKRKVQVCESPVKSRAHSKFNRSLSDSDTSSTYNKICTLQSELRASREDCKVLTEDIATIKRHLNCSSNISVVLDETERIYSNDIPLTTVLQTEHFQEFRNQECHLDEYTADKIDCYNYYIEKTGVELGNDASHIKMIEIMNLLYNSLDQKHGNEVEYLVNKIRCYEESQKTTQEHISKLKEDYCTLLKNVEDKGNKLNAVTESISRVKTSIHIINEEVAGHERKNLKQLASLLTERFLKVLETDFGFQCVSIFGFIFAKYEDDLRIIEEQCNLLKNKSIHLTAEVDTANHNVDELKQKLFEKENEFNLLIAQKDETREISNVVTLNIIKNEQELNDSIRKGYEKLLQLNVINYDSLNLKGRSKDNINILIESLLQQQQHLNDEMTYLDLLKTMLEYKEKTIGELNAQIQILDEINNLVKKGNKSHKQLNNTYEEQKLQKLTLIEELTKEINLIKETLGVKEASIASLYEKERVTKDLLDNITKLKDNNDTLKAVNKIITEEKESSELQKSCETVKQNNLEIHNNATDILKLRASLRDATDVIEGLKSEIQTLTKENTDLKQKYEGKSRGWLILENIIKTREKTAEIQNKIIIRYKKQKKEDDILIGELQAEIIELKDKLTSLREENQAAKTAYQQELIRIKSTEESLEARVSELEEAGFKPRVSIKACPRRRRQSIHDSTRPLEGLEEHRNLESLVAARQNTDDLFTVHGGEDVSGGSTPLELGKRRDSQLSRTDQSDKDDERPSRAAASGVLAMRRRRQSSHDLHRGIVLHTPCPCPDESTTDGRNERDAKSEENERETC